VPAPRSSSGRSTGAGSRKSSAQASRTRKPSGAKPTPSAPRKRATGAREAGGVSEGLATLAELLVASVLRPLDAVLITRDRMQETLEEAVERGRLTRTDANELVAELFNRGRQQTDDLLVEVERLLGAATKRARKIEPVDRIVRGADRARRTVGVGPAFPIVGYDELTSGQVEQRLGGLKPADLRRVLDYERRHANRKSVLARVEKALA
jgi:polyhydroxyalkanoate synthesis regulator phasin